jgi:hypothetical protein
VNTLVRYGRFHNNNNNNNSQQVACIVTTVAVVEIVIIANYGLFFTFRSLAVVSLEVITMVSLVQWISG